jgi:hypothetical protein
LLKELSNKMKSIFVFGLFAIIAVAHADDIEAFKEQLAAVTKECAEKTNFSEEGIRKLYANDYSLTPNVQCFEKCFFETSGVIHDAAIDVEKLALVGKAYNKDEVKAKGNLEKCKQLYKPDSFDCDAAWEFAKCFNS